MSEDLNRFLRDAHVLARLVEQVLEAGYLRVAADDAVTFDQLNILKFLLRPIPSLVKDVARFLNASYAAASKAVSRLEKKKLVRTSRYGPDGRAELLTVTARGRSLVRKYETIKARRLKTLLGDTDLKRMTLGLEEAIALLLRERAVAGNPCMGCGAYYAKQCIVRMHGQTCPCQVEA